MYSLCSFSSHGKSIKKRIQEYYSEQKPLLFHLDMEGLQHCVFFSCAIVVVIVDKQGPWSFNRYYNVGKPCTEKMVSIQIVIKKNEEMTMY
jgi:hypothetical protein